jgi:glycosyltransferase involved in cell wall biosynthesis
VIEITVAIPTIPPRREMLARALASVAEQSLPAVAVSIAVDTQREGAAMTRERALNMVTTEYVAFLDDDDELYPCHLARLSEKLLEEDADLVYPWFDVIGGTDPFPQFEERPWDNAAPHQVPITFLARTDAVRDAGGFLLGWDPGNVATDALGNRAGEDYRLILRMVAKGHRIAHLVGRTWAWHHWSYPKGNGDWGTGNTSGLPDRW